MGRAPEVWFKSQWGLSLTSPRVASEKIVKNFLNLIHAKARCALADPASPAS